MKKTLITLIGSIVSGAVCGAVENMERGFGTEVSAVYNVALKDVADDVGCKVNTYGLDMASLYKIDKHHSVNIHFALATGDNDEDGSDRDVNSKNSEPLNAELIDFTIMPGYRFTTALTKSVDIFCGVNAGLVWSHAELTNAYGKSEISEKQSKWDYAWGAEIGTTHRFSEDSRLMIAISLQSIHAQLPFRKLSECKANRQLRLGIRAGYTSLF